MSDIEDIIQHSVEKNYAEAGKAFNAAIQGKIEDRLDQHKAMIAQSIYGDEQEGDEEPVDLEASEEDDDQNIEDLEAFVDDEDAVEEEDTE